MQSLRAALQNLGGGAPMRWVISGDAGIGKTRMALEAMSSAAGAGVAVLEARAFALESDRPFGAFDGLLRGDFADGHATVARIVALVKQQSLEAPTLLILEDAHWADRMSLATLNRVLEDCRHERVGVLVTRRRFPPSPALGDLMEQERHGFVRLDLEGIPAVAVQSLVRDLIRAAPGPRLLRLAAGAAGNPRLVRALISSLQQADALRRVGAAAEIDRDLPPASMWSLVQARLSSFGTLAQGLLLLAATLEQPWSMTTLAAAAGRPLVDMLGELREVIAAGLLVGDGGPGLRFRHELVRAALNAAMPAPPGAPVPESDDRTTDAPPVRSATAVVRSAVAAAPEAPSWGSRLTAAEREVVSLVARGLSNKQVGARLSISPRTVETHLAHVFGKLGIGSRIELAVAVARSAGTPADEEAWSATA